MSFLSDVSVPQTIRLPKPKKGPSNGQGGIMDDEPKEPGASPAPQDRVNLLRPIELSTIDQVQSRERSRELGLLSPDQNEVVIEQGGVPASWNCCATLHPQAPGEESKAKKIVAPASVQMLGERAVGKTLAGRQEKVPGFSSTVDFEGLPSLLIAVGEPDFSGVASRTFDGASETMPVERDNPTTPMERFSMHRPGHPLEGRLGDLLEPQDSVEPIDDPHEIAWKAGQTQPGAQPSAQPSAQPDPVANPAPHGQVSKQAKEQVEKAIKFFESQDADGTRRKIFQSDSPRIDAQKLAAVGRLSKKFSSAIVVTPSVGQPLSNQDLADMLDQKYPQSDTLKVALLGHFNEQSNGIKAMAEDLSVIKRDKKAVLASLNERIENEQESLNGITDASQLVAHLDNLRSKCSEIIHENKTVPSTIYRRMEDIKKEQRKIGLIGKLRGCLPWNDKKTRERKIKIDNCETAIQEAKNRLSYSITRDFLLDLGEQYRFPSTVQDSDKAGVQTLMLTVPSLAAEPSVVDLSAVQNPTKRNHYADGVRFALKYGDTKPLKDMLTTIYRGLLDKLDGRSTLVVLEPMDLQQLGIDKNLLGIDKNLLKEIEREALGEVLKDRSNVQVIINGPRDEQEALEENPAMLAASAAGPAAPEEGPAAPAAA